MTNAERQHRYGPRRRQPPRRLDGVAPQVAEARRPPFQLLATLGYQPRLIGNLSQEGSMSAARVPVGGWVGRRGARGERFPATVPTGKRLEAQLRVNAETGTGSTAGVAPATAFTVRSRAAHRVSHEHRLTRTSGGLNSRSTGASAGRGTVGQVCLLGLSLTRCQAPVRSLPGRLTIRPWSARTTKMRPMLGAGEDTEYRPLPLDAVRRLVRARRDDPRPRAATTVEEIRRVERQKKLTILPGGRSTGRTRRRSIHRSWAKPRRSRTR